MTTPKAKFAGLALIAVLCAGFTLGLTAPAWAGFDEAMAAYQRGDYATALHEWHPLADQGAPMPNSSLAACTTTAAASPRTTPKPICGLTLLLLVSPPAKTAI